MEFILSGGALESLVDFLTPRVKSALIVTPKGSDLEILDAVGTRTEGLFLKEWASKLSDAFPNHPMSGKFETTHAAIECEWPWAIRVRGMQWSLYVLLREPPGEKLLEEIAPVAGLIALWRTFQQIGATEERLSRLSYMILATKNTLASIFEPMPLDYYAAFLTDVLRESLFPRSLSIFQDDGAELSFLEGDERTPPAREGLYTQTMLPPAPIVTRKDAAPYEIVLPIMEAFPHKLFCVSEWDKLPTEETLNFLELVGSLASRSLSINRLQTENLLKKAKISSGDFTLLSIAEALNTLKSQKERSSFLSLAADIFSEFAQVSECFLVVWDQQREGYVPAEYRKNGIRSLFSDSLQPSALIVSAAEYPFLDLRTTEISRFLQCPWPEMANIHYVFPFWNRGRMVGFVALSSEAGSASGSGKFSAIEIFAQFVALNLMKFME
jgi:hypothetical protein